MDGAPLHGLAVVPFQIPGAGVHVPVHANSSSSQNKKRRLDETSISPRMLQDIVQMSPVPFVLSPIYKHVDAFIGAVHTNGKYDVPHGDAVYTVAKRMFDDSVSFQMMTKTSEAELAGSSRMKTVKITRKLAEFAIVYDRLRRHSLEKSLVSCDRVKPLYYIECEFYDESPMPFKLRDCSFNNHIELLQDFAAVLNPKCVKDGVVIPSELPAFIQQSRTEASIAKMLQVDSRYACLLKVESGGAKRYIFVHSSTLNHLVVIDRNTGEATRGALRLRWSVSLAHKLHEQRVRLVTTDQGGGCIKCERGIAEKDRQGWQHLHLHCEVHITSLVHKNSFKLVTENVTGMVRCALSLKLAGHMGSFRQVLREVIGSMILFKVGAPPPEAFFYRRMALRLLSSSGSLVIQKFVALNKFPNGDWRNRSNVEVYVPAFPDGVDLDAHKAKYKTSLYPRDKWTGADACIDQFLSQELCHGLLTKAYPIWAKSMGAKASSNASAAMRAAPHAEVPLLMLPSGDGGDGDGEAGEGEGDPANVGDDSGGAGGDRRDEDLRQQPVCQFRAEENAKDRQVGINWVLSKPMTPLIIMRLTMVPLSDIMGRLLDLGSPKWEREQRVRELASASNAGPLAGNITTGRDYPIVVAAEGTIEDKFFEKLETLLTQPAMWSLVLEEECTEQTNALAFKMLSRAGCLVAELVRELQKYPYRLFLVLHHPHMAATIESESERVLGKFTKQFLQDNPDLSADDARMRLLSIAAMAKLDISHIEALHASIRRLVVAASHQTHTIEIAAASAEWVASRCRSRAKNSAGLTRTTFVDADSAEPAEDDEPRKPRGGGGAWRAFVAMSEPGVFKDFAQLAVQYRQLDADQKEKHITAGRAATAAHREHPDVSSFGNNSKQEARLIAAERRAQLTLQLGSLASSEGPSMEVVAANQIVATQVDNASALAAARSATYNIGRMKAKDCRDKVSKLKTFAVDEAALRLAVGDVPPLAAVAEDLQRLPGRACSDLEFVPDIGSTAAKATCASQTTRSSGGTSNTAALTASWYRRHNIVCHDDCERIADQPKDFNKQMRCWKFGRCICNGEGKKLYSIRKALLRVMKKAFPRKSTQFPLLVNGSIFAAIFPPLPADLVELGAERDWLETDELLVVHVGVQYLKPYRPTYHKMRLERVRDDGIWDLQA
ncbi:unnamed protein product [Prorocentrum cordatum]|uniref:Uncharacterized protein n=1 Tax=Prorocentrum cordatum TaxID=2364126 RepID=A0ABN9W3F6_9DINO|nr:unnamed protein product [Polarella glacialis]